MPTLSIADASAPEGDTMTFAITLSAPTFEAVTVTLDLAGHGRSADVEGKQLQLTIPAGTTTASFTVKSAEDALDEPDETSTSPVLPSGATIADGTAPGTIADDDAQPTVAIAAASAAEGNPVRLPVTLSAPSGREVTVRLTTTDGTAVAPGDYTAQSLALVTIPAGQTSVDALVPTATDASIEPAETFTATLSQPTNATVGTASATGTITEASRTVSVGPAPAVAEAGQLAFPVTLSSPSATDTTVNLTTEDGTATAPGDYTAATLAIVIPAGQTAGTFSVQTNEDQVVEPSETVKAKITGASGQVVAGTTSATGTITDVAPRVLDIGPAASVPEDGQLVFPVTLSRPSPTQSTVTVTAENGTATSPGDYTAKTETLTIPAGQSSVNFVVQTLEDQLAEGDETVKARITGGGGRLDHRHPERLRHDHRRRAARPEHRPRDVRLRGRRARLPGHPQPPVADPVDRHRHRRERHRDLARRLHRQDRDAHDPRRPELRSTSSCRPSRTSSPRATRPSRPGSPAAAGV